MFGVRIARYEIHYYDGGGHLSFYAAAEIVDKAGGELKPGRIIAAVELPDCGRNCQIRRSKPDALKLQRIRAVGVDKLNLKFPSCIGQSDQTETLISYTGHFTRKESEQYVAFFARHAKGALDDGEWAAYIVDSDFSLVAVLDRDEYLHVVPDGIVDVNGDGLDEIWANELGYEGSAYSLWYLQEAQIPLAFERLRWGYIGL